MLSIPSHISHQYQVDLNAFMVKLKDRDGLEEAGISYGFLFS